MDGEGVTQSRVRVRRGPESQSQGKGPPLVTKDPSANESRKREAGTGPGREDKERNHCGRHWVRAPRLGSSQSPATHIAQRVSSPLRLKGKQRKAS